MPSSSEAKNKSNDERRKQEKRYMVVKILNELKIIFISKKWVKSKENYYESEKRLNENDSVTVDEKVMEMWLGYFSRMGRDKKWCRRISNVYNG